MTAKRIPRQIKPDTAKNASSLDDIIQRQMWREKRLIPVRINKTTIVLRNRHKFHYRVFMSDIEDIVKGMVRGRIKGSFTWVKKGSDYGIQLVKVTDRKNGNAESCIG